MPVFLPILAAMLATGAGGSAIGADRRRGKARNPLDDDPDRDVIDPAPEGAFMSFLDAFGHAGHAVNDALVGNFEGAGRQAVDLAGDVVDAALPGDWIPHISRRKDKANFSDVLGGIENPAGKFAADVIGGAATDPTSLIPMGAIGKVIGGTAKLAAEAAAKQFPKTAAAVAPVVDKAAFAARKTFAALTPTKQVAEDTAAAKAVGAETRKAAQEYPAEAFKDVDPSTARRAIETLRGVTSELGHGYTDLQLGTAQKFGTKSHQMELVSQRIEAMPWDDATKSDVFKTIDKIVDYTRGQFDQGVKDQVFKLDPAAHATSNIATKQLDQAPLDYFPGRYLDDVGKATKPNLTAGKTLGTSADLTQHLNTSGSKLDPNVATGLADYGSQMGNKAQSAAIGSKTLGQGFEALADAPSKQRMLDHIKKLRESGDVDSAHVLETAFKGLPPPGKLTQWVTSLNKPFKAAATAGILLPRINFTVRNVASSVWQAFSNQEAREGGQVAGSLVRAVPNILKSIRDGLTHLGVPSLTESEAAILTKAAKASGGTREGMMAHIHDPTLRAAAEHNVLGGGFVNTEEMMATAAQQERGVRDWHNWAYWPQSIAKASEQHLRYGMFKDLAHARIAAGEAAPNAYREAARITNDTLLDYDLVSAENRGLRAAFPFAQFTLKSVPTQTRLFDQKPMVVGALSRALGEHEDPVYPYMEGKLNIPVGKDEQGGNQYLTSLGLPFETLNAIPDLSAGPMQIGEDLRHNEVGAANPLLKTAYAALSGRDPYFDTPFGSYSKFPGNIEGGAAGRAYNTLAGTGAIQPLASNLQTIGKLIDDRTSLAEKGLGLLTGAKIQSVDPNRAATQQLAAQLQADPNVRQSVTYYSQDPDDSTDRLLRAWKQAKAKPKTPHAKARKPRAKKPPQA